jgi:hypothetical protein
MIYAFEKYCITREHTSFKWLHFISLLWLVIAAIQVSAATTTVMMLADVPTPVETIYFDMINIRLCYRILFMINVHLCYRILFMTYWPSIKVLKLMRMRWVGPIAWLGKKRNAYRSLVGKPKQRVCFEDLCVNGRIMLERDLKKWNMMGWCLLGLCDWGMRLVVGSCVQIMNPW